MWQKSRERGAGSRESELEPPAPNPQPLYTKLTEFTGHDGAVYAAAFSPDGKLRRHRRLRQARDDLESRRSRNRSTSPSWLDGQPEPKPNYLRLTGHDGPVRSVAFSPNGQLVASGSDDNAIRLWDVATGEVSQVAPRPRQRRPLGRLLARWQVRPLRRPGEER